MFIIGILFIVFGLIDLFASFVGIDIWGQWLHIHLSEEIWEKTAYFSMVIGGVFITLALRFNRASTSKHNKTSAETIIKAMLITSAADGHIDAKERSLLKALGDALGIPEQQISSYLSNLSPATENLSKI